MTEKPISKFAALLMVAVCLPGLCLAQVNSGSDGSDGVFNPTTNIVINMADHPDGIYRYTSVFIPTNVTVTFIPNANNTPVIWLVQSNVLINGIVDLSGSSPKTGSVGGFGGPGGWAGGTGGGNPGSGQGPGGGPPGLAGGTASYGDLGATNNNSDPPSHTPPGPIYGNTYLIPLLGGSGGGGGSYSSSWPPNGGGGGGGAILISSSDTIRIDGEILAYGGGSSGYGGGGSGGAIRLVSKKVIGAGRLGLNGGMIGGGQAGSGRIRFDTLENGFGGFKAGVFSQGFQPIIIPASGTGAQLAIVSVAGSSVSTSPSGALATPDAVLSAQQNNPIPIVVRCSNLPLNTPVTVSVKPMNGSPVSATGYNTTGTLANSTATVLVNMPRGGGLIYATAATGN